MKRLFISVIIVLISLGAIWPLLGAGYFPMHDDTQVARVIAMGRALREGQFPVRWVSDLGYGYGYPIFNFYGPFPYYFAGILVVIGLPALIATKAMFVLGAVLLSITTFVLVRTAWGTAAGILASTLALYAPYHAVQIYVRGAVGEFWASAFIPLILLGFLYITKKTTQKRGILVGGLGLAATILSHTITGYMTIALLIAGGVVYGLTCLRDKHVDVSVVRSGFILVLFGMGLSAFFWLPAIFEMHHTAVSGQIGESADFHKHFVCASQLWESAWGFGGSVSGCIDGLSFKLGKLHIILAGVGILLWMKQRRGFSQQLFYAAIFLLIWSLWFATPISAWAWDRIAGYPYIQYPWRFLSGATLALSLAAGIIGAQKKRIIRWTLIPLIVVIVILVNTKWFRPQYLYPKDSRAFETTTELRFRASKVSDEYLPPQIIRPDNEQEIVTDIIAPNKNLSVVEKIDTAAYAKFIVTAHHEQEILIRKAYFPGWKYYVNTNPVEPLLTRGLPSILVPEGESTVEVGFTDTPVRSAANLITIATIVWLFIFYAKTKKTNS